MLGKVLLWFALPACIVTVGYMTEIDKEISDKENDKNEL